MLFEIWIVDASILQPRSALMGLPFGGWPWWVGVVVCLLCVPVDWPVCMCGSLWRVTACVCVCAGCVPVCVHVLCGWVTSCEGHVVDALASRADEGRRSLR